MDDFHLLCEQKIILVHNYIEKIMIYDKSKLRYKYSWIWFVIYIISMIAK